MSQQDNHRTVLTASVFPPGGSKREDSRLEFDSSTLFVMTEDAHQAFTIKTLRISQSLANTRATIRTSDGWMFEVIDSEALDRLRALQGGNSLWQMIAGLERHWKPTIAVLALTILLVFGWLKWGMPVAANLIADSIPNSALKSLGDSSLEFLEDFGVQASTLDDVTQQRLTRRFNQLSEFEDTDHGARLVFRQGGPIGANAFALPSGLVVMTDELVKLSDNDDQLVAVMAHEVGHVKYRHGIRMVLQDSGTVLLLSALTGDIASSSSFAASIPTVLIDAKYSRDFEREADLYAANLLNRMGMDVTAMAGILQKFGEMGDESNTWLNYFSSHPPSQERIEALQPTGD
jgi:Zn-dependent protease with chaperone function